MPIYVYECSTCQKTLEVSQRISEDPLKDCPCGAAGSLKRVIQPIAVMFKGAGFHINDYNAPKADVDSTPTPASADAPAAESVAKGPETPSANET